MNNLNLTYVNNIVLLRNLHSISRIDLAKHMKVTYNTIKKWELATDIKPIMSYKQIEDLAKLFNVSIFELVGDEQLSFKINLKKKMR